jgi:hypothetical protein
VHLLISVLHGRAHAEAHVGLSPFGTQFVYLVILAGPLLGLLMALTIARRAGVWLVAISMAGAFVFGIVNHFVLQSPDHVSQVAGSWGVTFAATAVLLAITEAAASLLALQQTLRHRRLS